MSELERLRDRVEELEELLGMSFDPPNQFGLTITEAKIIGVLIKREIANSAFIHAAIYGGLPECDQPDEKTIDVHLCKARKKLKAHGIRIYNRYNVGYYLDASVRAQLKNPIAEAA